MARHVCPMCGKVFGTAKQLGNHRHDEIVKPFEGHEDVRSDS